MPPRALPFRPLLGLVSLALLLATALPSAFALAPAGAATSVGATGGDDRPFPRTFHIWGGSPSQYTKYDLVIGYPDWNLATLRAANPGAIYLLNPMLDPWNPDWRLRKGVAVTYGAANSFSGATDTVSDGPAASLGTIPGWNTYWDTLHRPDGTVAAINSTWGHPGWNLTRTDTAEKVAEITAYAAKLSKIYRNGWDGIWSDNWIYRIGASWFYGTDLDTNRDGRRDDIGVVSRQWWDGLTLVGQRLRSYLPGKIVGGNGAHNIAGLVGGSDPDGPYKTTNITMNEVLELYTTRPDTIVSEVQSYLGFSDQLGMPRYFLLKHKLPGGQGDYRAMRWGFSLATIAGAYYEPYASSDNDAFSYDEFTGGSAIGRRGWLGRPVSAPTKLANGVWRRDFENGVVLNNSTSSAQTISLGRTYQRLKGAQDPTVNSGASVSSVTIPAGDGLFLAGSSGAVAAPEVTEPPVVSGTPVVGGTLTASTGTWSGSPSSYAYQWQACDAAGGGCTDVAGATSSAYVVQKADVGSTLRVRVTATSPYGSRTAYSRATAVVADPFVVAHSIADGSTLSSTVSWSATASGKAVSRVEFRVNDALVASDSSAPFETSVDTTRLADGTHRFAVRALATDSTSADSVASVTVANGASTAFSVGQSIVQGQTLSGVLRWSAQPSGVEVKKVEFYVDGAKVATKQQAPFEIPYDTTRLADGTHGFGVTAYAATGSTARSYVLATVSNTVSAPMPSYSVSQSIADGSTVSGRVPWTASPSGKTVERVEFFIDGRLAWTERYAPYVYAGDGNMLDTVALVDGWHTLSVRAYATDGATASASASVRIANAVSSLMLVSSIQDGATITGSVSWTVTPSGSGKEVSRVEFFIDGRLAWTERYAPYVYGGDGRKLDTRTLSRGQHTFVVKGFAGDGTVAVLQLRVNVS